MVPPLSNMDMQASIGLKRRLTLYIDVEKGDGRHLRYHIAEDPPCPQCGATGCKSAYIDGKEYDWTRICQKCGHEFSLIEELPRKNKNMEDK